MSEYLIETLLDGDATAVATTADGEDVEVLVGTIYSESGVSDSVIVEVYEVTDVDNKVESYQFSQGGNLSVTVGSSQLPITGGTFSIVSVAARVGTAPVGSNVVVDIKKNGTSIFAAPADRPTIVAGANIATVGSWGNTTLTTDDYVSVDIVQVGSSTAGADLVVPIRLRKIA